jgi:hypothetical protein
MSGPAKAAKGLDGRLEATWPISLFPLFSVRNFSVYNTVKSRDRTTWNSDDSLSSLGSWGEIAKHPGTHMAPLEE